MGKVGNSTLKWWISEPRIDKKPFSRETSFKSMLVEDKTGEKAVYDSVVLPPSSLAVFGSELALRIVDELAREPGCAMDLAKRLKEHEQKIYYHLKKFERASIVRQIRTEKRYGMTAKIYGLVSPVVATKLNTEDYHREKHMSVANPRILKFLCPFIVEGSMNSIVVLGDTYSHGRFDTNATDGPHAFDLALMLGGFVKRMNFPNYKLDTEIKQSDLRNNLILIGNPKTNTIIDRIRKKLPIRFDEKNNWNIISGSTKKTYSDPRTGVIIKMKNPFDESKRIFILGGKTRQRGTRAAIVAFTRKLQMLADSADENGELVKIVKGFDMEGDKIIDSVEVLE